MAALGGGARADVDGRGAPQHVIHLLGRFDARMGSGRPERVQGRKTTELLSYLLLFRDRPHHREVLAGTIWPDSDTEQSKKYLRQSLWQLRAGGAVDREPVFLRTDADWINVNPANAWIDVAQLEKAFARAKSVPGEQMSAEDAGALKSAVSLYRGDLLEGCYLDWCVYERERLRALYLALLEKLLGYCEAHFEHEEGLTYGELLLRHDHAHERAHWRLMRLRYLAGDRTGALRQFDQCREALRAELDVEPGGRIRSLYERIRTDGGLEPLPSVLLESAPEVSVRPAPRRDTEAGLGLPADSLESALRTFAEAARLVALGIRQLEASGPAAVQAQAVPPGPGPGTEPDSSD